MNQILLKNKLLTKSNVLVCYFFLFSFLNIAFSQEVYDLSRCIQAGLEQNFSLQVSRNLEQIAINNNTPGNAGMLPNIDIINQYGGRLNNGSQSLRNGGENAFKGIYNDYGSAGINLEMTIFKGFQVQRTHQKLGLMTEMEKLNTQMLIENLVAQIVAEYNNYIQQLNLYENLAYAVSLSRERVRIDEQRYLLGGASKLELLQSIVYLNADSSRYARQKEVLKTSQIRLNELMASDNPGEDIILKDSLIYIDESFLYDELFSLILLNNTSLQIASKKQVITELDYKIIKSRSYPYLTVASGYGYAYNGYGAGDYINQYSYGMNYGFTMGIDIFDGFNRKREKNNALIEIENRKIEYKEVEQEVKADLLTIYYAYENNLFLLKLEEQNLDVARENLDIALERYKLGSLSGIELREVQKSLLDAEERLISVKYQTKLAEISLLQIAGKIMDYL